MKIVKVNKRTIKNKERGFDEIDKHISLTTLNNQAQEVYKLFGGVQSWVGEIGIHASLKNWRFDDHVGSIFVTKIPHPAHLPTN